MQREFTKDEQQLALDVIVHLIFDYAVESIAGGCVADVSEETLEHLLKVAEEFQLDSKEAVKFYQIIFNENKEILEFDKNNAY